MTGVATAKGTIEGPIVVDAAGAWTRQVAEASGIRVPLVPTRQQLIVTEPLDGVHANLPMVRIMDAAVYMRPCQGGLLWGVYEEAPRFFDMQSLGRDFDIKDMPLDIEVLRSAAAAETLIMIAADPKASGAHIGLTAILHTWGSAHYPIS